MNAVDNFKIAFFLPSLMGGGAERITVTLANGLAQCGYRVDLVLASAKGGFVSQVSSQVQMHDLSVERVFLALPGLVRYLRQERPDVIISGMTHANLIAILSKALSMTNTRVVIVEHTVWSWIKYQSNLRMEKFLYSICKWLYPQADAFVAVSHSILEDVSKYVSLSPEKSFCIYNPVIFPNFDNLKEQPVSLSWLADKKNPVILAVGRLVAEKDFATLIRAFALVRRRVVSKLIILGEGAERTALEDLVRELGLVDDVVLPGYIQNPYAYMAKSDLFAVSSLYEGLPTVVIEALACGLPVVSTDSDASREALENGKYGVLVPLRDELALANALLTALSTNHNKEILLERACEFSTNAAIENYLRLFQFLGVN